MNLKAISTVFFLPFVLRAGVALADDAKEKDSKPAREERGYLGVMLSTIPEALQAHVKLEEGALVQQVSPGSPAEKAGLRRYDVIVSVNGENVKGPEELKKRIHGSRAGDSLKLGVRRGNETLTMDTALAAAPAEAVEREEQKERTQPGFLGVGFAPVPAELAFHLNLEEDAGALVVDVSKGSPAEKAGIENRDVLVAVDGRRIQRAGEFSNLLSQKKAGDEVQVELIHRGEKKTVKAVLAARPKRISRRLFHPGDGPDLQLFPPHSSQRGRIILRGPDGQEDYFNIPDGFFKARESAEELIDDLEEQFGQFKDHTLPGLKEGLRKSLRELEARLKDGDGDELWSTNGSETSVHRMVDNDYDITVRDLNGIRTVTVKKGGQILAEDLPYDKVDTLPADARERVQKLAGGIEKPAARRTPRLPRLPRTEDDGERVRA